MYARKICLALDSLHAQTKNLTIAEATTWMPARAAVFLARVACLANAQTVSPVSHLLSVTNRMMMTRMRIQVSVAHHLMTPQNAQTHARRLKIALPERLVSRLPAAIKMT
jgi:hypothetical protein